MDLRTVVFCMSTQFLESNGVTLQPFPSDWTDAVHLICCLLIELLYITIIFMNNSKQRLTLTMKC